MGHIGLTPQSVNAMGGFKVQGRKHDAALALAEDAKARNMRNGSMVHTHLDFTQRALHFLQSSVQLFYGPDGVRKTAGGGNRLALG